VTTTRTSRGEETDALVVRSVEYGETDRIVTLLTEGQGKVGAIARGASRSKRRFGGALQPLQLIRVKLTRRSRSELALLREAEVVRAFPLLASDPARYAFASTVVEVVRELTPHGDPDPRPLRFLVAALTAFEAQGPRVEVLAAALIGALGLGGFAPALDRCAACGRPAPPRAAAHFDLARGVVCRKCGGAALTIRGRVREAMVRAAAGEKPAEASEAELCEGVRLLVASIEVHLDKQLKSGTLLRQYLRPS